MCFQQGSTSVTGDNGIHVKIVARKDSTPQETARFLQIAEQACLHPWISCIAFYFFVVLCNLSHPYYIGFILNLENLENRPFLGKVRENLE